MGLYVEVMCDARSEGRDPNNILRAICHSNEGENPQGYSVADARKEARRLRWKVGPGRRAVCPGCLASPPTPSPEA